MTYHPRAHFDDCRSSLCDGCYDDPLADLGAAARAALVARGKAIAPKTLELDACTCPYVDPKYWTTHYGAVEPGSMQEWDPDCPSHPGDKLPNLTALAAEARKGADQ